MKILKIEAFPYDIPLRKPWKTRYGQRQIYQVVIIKLTTSNGIVGLGECFLLPHFTGDTQKNVLETIENEFSPALANEDCMNVEKLVGSLDRLPANYPAKAAIDIAIHDAIAQKLGVPLYELIGGKYRETITLAEAIGENDPKEVRVEAEQLVGEGITLLKQKIGFGYERDLDIVKSLKEAIGDRARFWVDANASYRPRMAIKVIKSIEKYDPEYIEQPVGPRYDLKGLAEVRRAVDTPIMADESVGTASDALAVIESRAADVIGIKFTKCGGILKAKRIAAVAEAAGIPCLMIGGGTGIVESANAHMALSTPNVSIPCNISVPTSENWLDIGLSREGGIAKVSSRVGLGVRLVEKSLPPTLRSRQP